MAKHKIDYYINEHFIEVIKGSVALAYYSTFWGTGEYIDYMEGTTMDTLSEEGEPPFKRVTAKYLKLHGLPLYGR